MMALRNMVGSVNVDEKDGLIFLQWLASVRYECKKSICTCRETVKQGKYLLYEKGACSWTCTYIHLHVSHYFRHRLGPCILETISRTGSTDLVYKEHVV